MTTNSNSGVYIIQNQENWKVYVGSSTDLKQRKRDHFSRLRLGTHPCVCLQEDFDEYGEDAFEFIVIADNLPGNLEYYEQNTIDVYESKDPEYGYNQNNAYIPPGEELLEWIDEHDANLTEAAEEFNTTVMTIRERLVEFMGLEAYTERFGNPRRPDVPPGEVILEWIDEHDANLSEAAEEFNTNVETIRKRLIKFMGPEAYTERFGNPRRPDVPSGEELIRIKEEKGWSYRKLAEFFNCSVCCVWERIKKVNS